MRTVFSVAALCAALSLGLAAQAPETFTAFAVNMGSTRGANATTLDIHVDRYSSTADRDRLLAALDKGQDALLRELQKMPAVGYIRTPTSLRYDLHFAREIPQPEGGRMVVVATDRPIGMWEAVNQPRSIQYPFTLIQLKLDRDGTGVGKASIATKITKSDDGTIVLENFNSLPVMLNDVKTTHK